jgi:hypothetical protein
MWTVAARSPGPDGLVGVFSFAGETAGKECRPFPLYFADAPAFGWWAYTTP